jgi:hypothetical protein
LKPVTAGRLNCQCGRAFEVGAADRIGEIK